MNIQSEADVEKLVRSDKRMMDVLAAAEKLNLPDWWIGAGFLRNKIWDAIEGVDTGAPRDIDLVYFDASDKTAETDWKYDELMKQKYPDVEWEIRNQARMNYISGDEPYVSTEDGIAHWVETATCIGIKLEKGELKFLWCYGLGDVIGLIARPIPNYQRPERLPVFNKRVTEKGWQKRWPHLQIMNV